MAESGFNQLPHGMHTPRGDNVITRRVLLQHPPHRIHIIARMAPITARIQISQMQRCPSTLRIARQLGNRARNLACHKILTPVRALMIKQNPI